MACSKVGAEYAVCRISALLLHGVHEECGVFGTGRFIALDLAREACLLCTFMERLCHFRRAFCTDAFSDKLDAARHLVHLCGTSDDGFCIFFHISVEL